jgi:hypothetical protein
MGMNSFLPVPDDYAPPDNEKAAKWAAFSGQGLAASPLGP